MSNKEKIEEELENISVLHQDISEQQKNNAFSVESLIVLLSKSGHISKYKAKRYLSTLVDDEDDNEDDED